MTIREDGKFIRLDKETHELLLLMSKAEMRPMTQVIRKALQDVKTLREVAAR